MRLFALFCRKHKMVSSVGLLIRLASVKGHRTTQDIFRFVDDAEGLHCSCGLNRLVRVKRSDSAGRPVPRWPALHTSRAIEAALSSWHLSGRNSKPRHIGLGKRRRIHAGIGINADSVGAKRHFFCERPQSPAPDRRRDGCRERSDQASGVTTGRG